MFISTHYCLYINRSFVNYWLCTIGFTHAWPTLYIPYVLHTYMETKKLENSTNYKLHKKSYSTLSLCCYVTFIFRLEKTLSVSVWPLYELPLIHHKTNFSYALMTIMIIWWWWSLIQKKRLLRNKIMGLFHSYFRFDRDGPKNIHRRIFR